MTSEKTIGRLTLYRRICNDILREGQEHIHSHRLAVRAGATAAQVRRDLMVTGYDGSPKRGYDVRQLLESLRNFLDQPGGQSAALLGVGNLGRALLSHFTGRGPGLSIAVAFDSDPQKSGRVIHGCRCHPMNELEETLLARGIRVAILAIPAEGAQDVADRLVHAGIRGILNFSTLALRLPADVYVEHVDLTMSLEKVAYFSRDVQPLPKERGA